MQVDQQVVRQWQEHLVQLPHHQHLGAGQRGLEVVEVQRAAHSRAAEKRQQLAGVGSRTDSVSLGRSLSGFSAIQLN
jgi:hypothetical protein